MDEIERLKKENERLKSYARVCLYREALKMGVYGERAHKYANDQIARILNEVRHGLTRLP